MPELPEVETIRRDLLKSVRGLIFRSVRVHDARVVRGLSAEAFTRRLEGQRIRDVQRRGKAILFDLAGAWLSVQPMMTGQLVAFEDGAKVPDIKETRVIFRLSKNKVLLYNDQRLFGRLAILGQPEDLPYIRTLGPEPLDKGFTMEVLRERLVARKVAIKNALLDGKVIAGIGNIYAAEVLFQARISPRRKAGMLKRAELERLHGAIRSVLQQAVAMRGTSMRNYRDGRGEEGKYKKVIKVYAREGEPCRDCGAVIKRIVQAQRSTFFCPRCQEG